MGSPASPAGTRPTGQGREDKPDIPCKSRNFENEIRIVTMSITRMTIPATISPGESVSKLAEKAPVSTRATNTIAMTAASTDWRPSSDQ